MPCYPFIKDLTLEQYLDSGIGIDQDNHQVRMLSGCPELDAPWDSKGGPISTSSAERRHLEMAKRNIEEGAGGYSIRRPSASGAERSVATGFATIYGIGSRICCQAARVQSA
jgi:hypothetical protein